ncbi:MAG: phosphotransferase family protein [Nitrospinota bacterium]
MLHDALTPEIVENGLKEGMNQTLNDPRILAIRVIRYKLLRRCLIEYDVLESGSSGFSKPVTLIGKIRCRGLDIRPYLVQNQLWTRSFGPESKDNFLVPEPLGIIPDLHMLVYKKVDGIPATKLLSSERGDIVARQAARAAFKIHNCSVSPHRVHTVSDEMKILIDKLPTVAKEVPELKNRIQSILHVAAKLAASIAKPVLRPVHRNFYSDKILIGEKNTHVLDFDLFCLGDPALDIGNFIGHVIEQSLRTFGNPEALSRASNAIRDEYLKISGQSSARSIDAYTLLTLVRHIYISTLFQERRHFTETLLEFCERECHEFLRWPNPVNKGSRR